MRGRRIFRAAFRDAAADETGAAFLIFALALFLLAGAGALALDLSRVFLAKTRLSFAVEMAVVAATKNLPFLDDAALEMLAEDIARANFEGGSLFSFTSDAPPSLTLSLGADRARAEIRLSGEAAVPTTLLRALRFFSDVTVSTSVTARADQPELELALVMEATDGFAASGALDIARAAATDFASALASAHATGESISFALLPLGNALVNVAPHKEWVEPGLWPEDLPPDVPGTTGWSGDLAADRWCVAPRSGAAGEEDVPPAIVPFPLVLTLTSAPDPGTGLPHFENVTTTYCRAEALLPLGPAAALTDALATLGGNGEAAVGRAMLWAERLLSPLWRGLWAAGSFYPVDYDDEGRRKAVLLVAGSPAGDAGELARLATVCARLNARGVAIYTIDFLAPPETSAALLACAGDASRFYIALDAVTLREALFSIAKFLIEVRFPGA